MPPTLSAPDKASPAAIALKLLDYCQGQNWSGYDPYDGLNSKVFKAVKLLQFKHPRLALIQLLKRCPINLRPLLRIPREQNPKGIALFLTAIVRLVSLGLVKDDSVGTLANRLIELSVGQNGYAAWGYNFDWQTRGVLVPRDTPNIVCTTFAGHALLDAYEQCPDPRFFNMAESAARFIRDRLYYETGGSDACFTYYPQAQTMVHNANLLGAAFLCRVARASGSLALLPPALTAARFSTKMQHGDGSWDYGEHATQRWIDNFHTGFNLCALRRIDCAAEAPEFEPNIRRGFDFYRQHFFAADGAPKYYHDRLHPIDIHSVAQSILTLLTLRDLAPDNVDLACSVLQWAVKHMWDDRGFFYYRVLRLGTIRISYMRWSQAWMLLALSALLCESDVMVEQSLARSSATSP